MAWSAARGLTLGLGLLVAGSGIATASSPRDPRTAQLEVRPTIVDTDLGPDDVMALAWLLREPSLDILAVTVSGTGLAHCDPGVDNVRAILVALDATGPQVGCGRETPLGPGASFPVDWRSGADSLGGVPLPPAPDAGRPWRPAADIIGGLLDAAIIPVTILTLGPLTNLADALDGNADRMVRVSQVVAMGGALDVPGNVVPDGASSPGAAEWNLHVDPRAASEVLASGVPLTFVGLDATRFVPLTQDLATAIAADHSSAGANLVHETLTRNPYLLDGTFFLWDPLAAAALIDRSLITTREVLLRVETSGADAGRLVPDAAGLPAQVATAADAARFEGTFLAGLGLAAPSGTPPPLEGTITISWDGRVCSYDTGGVDHAGLVQLLTLDLAAGPVFGVLVGLGEGYTIDDLRTLIAGFEAGTAPPDWVVVAASIDADGGGTGQTVVDLPAGTYVGMCVTDPRAATGFVVADGSLEVSP